MDAYQGVQNFAAYAAAKAYVLRLAEALHRELKRDGIIVTALCPGMSDTGFAAAAQQEIIPALKLLMMRARGDSCAASRTHERRARLGQQGFRVPHLGHTALAAPSHYRSRHGRLN